MPKKDVEKFLEAKELVLENLEVLESWISQYEDSHIDPDYALYNEIEILMDQTQVCRSYLDLDEIIIKCREVEQNIDVWLSNHGQTQMELSWPAMER